MSRVLGLFAVALVLTLAACAAPRAQVPAHGQAQDGDRGSPHPHADQVEQFGGVTPTDR